MSKRNDSYICLATSTTMSDADLEVFNSMRNIRGLGTMIVNILTVMILANLGQRSCNSRTTFPKYTDSVLVLSGQETLSQRDKLAS